MERCLVFCSTSCIGKRSRNHKYTCQHHYDTHLVSIQTGERGEWAIRRLYHWCKRESAVSARSGDTPPNHDKHTMPIPLL